MIRGAGAEGVTPAGNVQAGGIKVLRCDPVPDPRELLPVGTSKPVGSAVIRLKVMRKKYVNVVTSSFDLKRPFSGSLRQFFYDSSNRQRNRKKKNISPVIPFCRCLLL